MIRDISIGYICCSRGFDSLRSSLVSAAHEKRDGNGNGGRNNGWLVCFDVRNLKLDNH